MMAQAGRRPTAGQEIRLAEFDADAGKGMGVVESLNGFANPTALIAALRDGASRYYGAVGMEWLRWMVEERPKLATFIRNGVRQFVNQYASALNGQVQRVTQRFGLVAVAGELATFCGLTGWAKDEAAQAVGKCFEAWLESFGGGKTNRKKAPC